MGAKGHFSGERPHVVVIGAGFAGLWAVKEFFGSAADVTLIDRNNYHTFLPLLYQAAAAEIEPEQIAYPVRTLLRGRRNVRFLRGDVRELDPAGKSVVCNGERIGYDYCILAAGSVTSFFGVPGAERTAFTLKTLDDAMIVRNHILSCYERAAYATDAGYRKGLLTFVIVGGGPTGVEFAGALAELARGPLRKDFPGIDPGEASVALVEAGGEVLPMFTPDLTAYAARKLGAAGVSVRLCTGVKEVTTRGVALSDGGFIPSETVVWTAGVSGAAPAGAKGLPAAKGGRIAAGPTLQAAGLDGLYVAGDLSHTGGDGAPLPMIAPVATQQGAHAARNILRRIAKKEELPFAYRDRGSMVTIGRNAAVARIAGRNFRGFAAWAVWLVIHIMNLIGFRNKLFVLVNWAWDYVFFERSVRLILPGCCDSPGGEGCLHRSCGR